MGALALHLPTTLSLLLVVPAAAQAAPGSGAPSGQVEIDPAIVGGEPAGTCQWPTTVALANAVGLCSGTLVHPRVVLYAAHCGTEFSEVVFGERANASFRVPVERCELNPDGGDEVGPSDYAYCLLAEPMNRIPITPVIYGCEGDALRAGAEVAIAGFGQDENEDFGVKRWAMTTIAGFSSGMILVGNGTTHADMGDSGGPAFIQLDDGGWRAFGIVSGGRPNSAVYYVDMRTVVGWVEEQSGIDITACHAADGSWQPTPQCGGYATAPTGADTWFDECGRNDPRSAPSVTCGGPFAPEENEPQVRILSPEDGTVLDQFPADITVEIEATDDTAVRAVRLAVDGEVLQERATQPWQFTGTFPRGTYELTAQAQDVSGNAAESDTTMLYVGEEPGGCGLCSAAGGRGGSAPLLVILALALARRRRRA